MMKYVLIFLLPIMVKAQTRDSIFLLKKEEVIKAAEAYFKKEHPEFSANAFDRVTVSKNNKNHYKADFRYITEYIPIGKAYYYSASCVFNDSLGFQESQISSFESDPELNATSFYHKNPADQKAIDFVFSAIRADNPHFFIQKGWNYRIYERKQVYEMEMENESIISFCTINKLTGVITDCRHKEKAPRPEFEDEEKWEELN